MSADVKKWVNLLTGETRESRYAGGYIRESEISVVWFWQVPPAGEPKYWQVYEGEITEMSSAGKAYVDAKELYLQKKAIEFRGFRFRAECPWPYVHQNYPEIESWCNAKQSIVTDIDSTTMTSLAFYNDPFSGFAAVLANDSNFTVHDVELFNPDREA